MFCKDKANGRDALDMDPKLYHGLWKLSIVLAEIAREGGEKKDGHNVSCPRNKGDGQDES